MTEFNVGDRVVVVRKDPKDVYSEYAQIGASGIVGSLKPKIDKEVIFVKFDSGEYSHARWLSGGIFVRKSMLELVSPVPYFEFTFKLCKFTFTRKESATFVKMVADSKYAYYGFAICDPSDKFDKLAGMRKALGRCVENRSEEGKAELQEALLKAWEESQKKPETQQQVGNYIIHINLKRNPVVVSWLLPTRGALIKGFVADNRVFLESEGWKDPKKETPIVGAVNANATIEFVYSDDAHIYKGYFGPKYFTVWETGLLQTEEQDKLRTPDVIAWRYINH